MTTLDLTRRIVHELLLYEPATGVLTWRRRHRRWFVSDRLCKTFNTQFAGKPALNYRDLNGYLTGPILGKNYYAHRVIFLYMSGRWPDPEADHVNRIRNDNRWTNLAEKTRQQQCRNASLSNRNTTGFVGVYLDKRRGTYFARVTVSGRKVHLGCFSTLSEAIAVRRAAQEQHGFSKGHGKAGGRTRVQRLQPWHPPHVRDVINSYGRTLQ